MQRGAWGITLEISRRRSALIDLLCRNFRSNTMNGNCNTCNIEKQCGYQYKPCDCRDYMKFKAIPPALQDHLAEAIRQHKIAGENARNVYKLAPKGAQK
jgi:hypothetical protein